MPTIMSSDERTFCPVPTCRGVSSGPEVPDKGTVQAREEKTPRRPTRHTDGAVLAVPARAAFTLAVAAGPVLGAARVAGPLVAGRPHPAFLAAAGAPHTHAVAPAVGSTDLCGEEEEGARRGRRGERKKKKVLSKVLAGNKSHTWLLRAVGILGSGEADLCGQ